MAWLCTAVMLDPEPSVASDGYCGVSTSAPEDFSLYHQYSQIVINTAAFTLSVIAFSIAWNRSKISKVAKQDLQLIQPILVVSAISTMILVAHNIIYILKASKVPNVTKTLQNIIVTYSSAAFSFSRIFVYFLTGKEFRSAVSGYWKRSQFRNTEPLASAVVTTAAAVPSAEADKRQREHTAGSRLRLKRISGTAPLSHIRAEPLLVNYNAYTAYGPCLRPSQETSIKTGGD
uniref:G_PROTEIN_RECEP_F3_4 domain-containing protein n=1 Tax=Syphacia muris TaxID=451379 RepID=A0A0N5AF46_9BILA